ncbi:MAG: hypothetical protein ACFNM7_03330 [Prevotella conceptionensis]
MELRKEIEPDFETVERLYPEVLKIIMDYTEYCDENGDEDNAEYEKTANTLHQMTGKDMSQYNLWEWWEEEGAEVLAFRISLPHPKVVDKVTKEELTELVRRLKTFISADEQDKSLKAQFRYYLDEYYTHFLELNFKSFDHTFFERNKDENGKYFEYTQEQIIERLWKQG